MTLEGDEKSAVAGSDRLERVDSPRSTSDAARKRAAVEMIARHERSLKRTAQRYSLSAEDVEDSYQRALEIVLTKAPTTDLRELIRWTHTVIKHEALAVRRSRERLLARPAASDSEATDWVALIPTESDGPAEQAERRETIARSREALKTLKPAELRALTLLAEGYSYAEIGELTGFSQTKVNRCLAEGRERFRSLFARSEDGSRCEELRQLLSAFCDGETSAAEMDALREHLRVCGGCRATVRAYRAAPRAAAVLAPGLPASRSLLERAQEALADLGSRLPGINGGGDTAAAQIAAAGGTQGAGLATLAKVLTVCVGTAGGAAACMATGVMPPPLDLVPGQREKPTIERKANEAPMEAPSAEAVDYEPSPTPAVQPSPAKPSPVDEETMDTGAEPSTAAGAVEYTAPTPSPAPAPAPTPPAPAPAPEPSGTSSSGSAAGEFGP